MRHRGRGRVLSAATTTATAVAAILSLETTTAAWGEETTPYDGQKSTQEAAGAATPASAPKEAAATSKTSSAAVAPQSSGLTATLNGTSVPLLAVAPQGNSSSAENRATEMLEAAAPSAGLNFSRIGQLDTAGVLLGQASGGPTLPATGVYNAANATPLEEVIVLAEKRQEILRDVPATVNVISAADVRERGYNNYSDYANALPGVFVADIGPGEQQLYVRGIAGQQGAGGFPVATYYGEARTDLIATNGGFQNLRLVDIDRVELLQGPQGTLYGANSLSGVLHVVPNDPELSDYQVSSDASGSYTDHAFGANDHVEGVFNVPLITERLAVRLVGYQDHDAGYINNVVPAAAANDYGTGLGLPAGTLVTPAHGSLFERGVNALDTYGGRFAARYQPTDDLTIDASYVRQEVRLNGENGVQENLGDFTQSLPSSIYVTPKTEETDGVGQLVLRYQLPDLRFPLQIVSASSESTFNRLGLQDFSFGLVSSGLPSLPISFTDREEAREFNQELRVVSMGNGPFQYLVGLYYQDSDIQSNEIAQDFSCPTCVSQNPSIFGLTSLPSNYLLNTNGFQPFERARQESVFTNLSYQFTPQWKLEAGVRYLRANEEVLAPATTGLLGTAMLPGVGGFNSVVSPSASLSFKPTDEITTYVQASKGFRPGSPNGITSFTGTSACMTQAAQLGVKQITDPDKLYNYELGLKTSLWDGRLRANASVFHQQLTNFQLFGFDGCAAQPIINGGDVVGNGGQLDLTAVLPYGFQVNLAASYVRNHFSSVNPNAAATDFFFVGEELPGAPSTNGTAGVQYNFSLTEHWKGFVRADYNYVGDVQYLFIGGVPFTQGGYGMGNLRLSVRRDDYEVEFFAKNFTNKYAVEYQNDPSQGNLSDIIAPRTVGVELRLRLDEPVL